MTKFMLSLSISGCGDEIVISKSEQIIKLYRTYFGTGRPDLRIIDGLFDEEFWTNLISRIKERGFFNIAKYDNAYMSIEWYPPKNIKGIKVELEEHIDANI